MSTASRASRHRASACGRSQGARSEWGPGSPPSNATAPGSSRSSGGVTPAMNEGDDELDEILRQRGRAVADFLVGPAERKGCLAGALRAERGEVVRLVDGGVPRRAGARRRARAKGRGDGVDCLGREGERHRSDAFLTPAGSPRLNLFCAAGGGGPSSGRRRLPERHVRPRRAAEEIACSFACARTRSAVR